MTKRIIIHATNTPSHCSLSLQDIDEPPTIMEPIWLYIVSCDNFVCKLKAP